MRFFCPHRTADFGWLQSMVKELGRLREEKTKGKQDYLSLEGYTVSNLGLQPGVSRLQGKISLEGYTPAKMAAEAALSWHQFTPARHFSV